MSDHSTIEWTEATWNPIAGCSVVSPGCTNCYAMRRVAPRLGANPATPHYAGTVQPSKAGPVWTGKIGIASDAVLLKPLGWRRPRMIFVNSTSDLFHPDVPDAVIDRIFAVMALCPQHTFQVLTKRPERMRAYLAGERDRRVAGQVISTAADDDALMRRMVDKVDTTWPVVGEGDPVDPDGLRMRQWPLPNVWLGTSVEDQQRADERIPHLLATPAAVRFISAEPLLGPIDVRPYVTRYPDLLRCPKCGFTTNRWQREPCPNDGQQLGPDVALDWVIVGGESGAGARPMHPDWARSLRDQCAAAGVPFFFKQWGEWKHGPEYAHFKEESGVEWKRLSSGRDCVRPALMVKLGTKATGRLLDGVEHNAMAGRA